MAKLARDVVVVMDPIASIKIAKDSTFAMLLEAQQRQYRLFYVTPGGLAMSGGSAVAEVAPLTVRDDPGAGSKSDRSHNVRWDRPIWS